MKLNLSNSRSGAAGSIIIGNINHIHARSLSRRRRYVINIYSTYLIVNNI